MTKHPYPAHIVTAVAKALWKTTPASQVIGWDDLTPQDSQHSDYTSKAHTALQALWDASRVDTLDELEALPDHSFIVDESGCCIAETPDAGADYLPAYILHWGNHEH